MNSDPLHPFIKGLVIALFGLIPVLGALILRSDPVIASTTVAPESAPIQTVQTFAKFIEKRPEFAEPPKKRLEVKRPETFQAGAQAPAVHFEPVSDAQQNFLRQMTEFLQDQNLVRDETWRSNVEKLFYVAESTGSMDALDLISTQIIAGRQDAEDVNRSRADVWVDRYFKIETRESKRREMSDFFREAVLKRTGGS